MNPDKTDFHKIKYLYSKKSVSFSQAVLEPCNVHLFIPFGLFCVES